MMEKKKGEVYKTLFIACHVAACLYLLFVTLIKRLEQAKIDDTETEEMWIG